MVLGPALSKSLQCQHRGPEPEPLPSRPTRASLSTRSLCAMTAYRRHRQADANGDGTRAAARNRRAKRDRLPDRRLEIVEREVRTTEPMDLLFFHRLPSDGDGAHGAGVSARVPRRWAAFAPSPCRSPAATLYNGRMPWLRHLALFVVFVSALPRPAAAGAFVSSPDATPQTAYRDR